MLLIVAQDTTWSVGGELNDLAIGSKMNPLQTQLQISPPSTSTATCSGFDQIGNLSIITSENSNMLGSLEEIEMTCVS